MSEEKKEYDGLNVLVDFEDCIIITSADGKAATHEKFEKNLLTDIIVRNGRLQISGGRVPDGMNIVQEGNPAVGGQKVPWRCAVIKRHDGTLPKDYAVSIHSKVGRCVTVRSDGNISVTQSFGDNGKVVTPGDVIMHDTGYKTKINAGNILIGGKVNAGTYIVPEGGKIMVGAVSPEARFIVGDIETIGRQPRPPAPDESSRAASAPPKPGAWSGRQGISGRAAAPART
jgi:hypothetical protein